MKPLNLDNRPCSPISSNCVIWQGPDIPCIKLCTGDSVSDVVNQLATELCTIMDTLKITNYDLSCFNLTACPPQDFQALIQFLIDKICELEGITPTSGRSVSSTCPDCVVNVAPCFVTGNQTTMQLSEYVTMIGEKVCSIVDQITDINNQLENLDIRVTVLENTPPPTFTLPSISTGCLAFYMSGATTATIDAVLNTLLNNVTTGYCALINATSLPANILAAVASQCISNADDSLANPGQTMATAYGPYTGFGTWQSTPVTAADAINNLWIALCDIRTAVLSSGTTVVDAGEGITVTSSTVGSTTTYTVTNDYLETFVANLTISTKYTPECGIINSIFTGNITTPGSPTYGGTPSDYKGITDGKPILKYTSVAANNNLVIANSTCEDHVTNACLPAISFGVFDNTTGVFTITDTGTYLINATIHLKPNAGSTVFWSGTTATDIGSFLIGITRNNATDMLIAQGQTMVPNIDKNVEISASKIITATGVTDLVVKVLNTTNRDYNGNTYTGGDFITFSITKLRNGLTSTNCPSCT